MFWWWWLGGGGGYSWCRSRFFFCPKLPYIPTKRFYTDLENGHIFNRFSKVDWWLNLLVPMFLCIARKRKVPANLAKISCMQRKVGLQYCIQFQLFNSRVVYITCNGQGKEGWTNTGTECVAIPRINRCPMIHSWSQVLRQFKVHGQISAVPEALYWMSQNRQCFGPLGGVGGGLG